MDEQRSVTVVVFGENNTVLLHKREDFRPKKSSIVSLD
jgi:hypothetical protein